MTKIKVESSAIEKDEVRVRVQTLAYNARRQRYLSAGKALVLTVPKTMNIAELVKTINRAVVEAVS